MGAAGYGAAVGISAAGTIYGALAADAAGAYNKSMAEYDARQLDDLAKDAIARGEEEAGRVGEEGRLVVGKQRAALAAQGLDVSTGTAADIIAQTMEANDRDIQTVRANAAREALGLQVQGMRIAAEGRAGRRAAQGQAVGTLLTGGAQALAIASQGLEKNNNLTNADIGGGGTRTGPLRRY